MARFGPSSWVQRTNIPALVNQPDGGFLSPYLDEKVFIKAAVNFTGGDPNWAQADACVTTDRGFSWTRFDANPSWPEAHFGFHAVELSPGVIRYVRGRYRVGRSFFVANNEIPAGYVALDISDDGVSWSETQKLYEWPHVPSDGAGNGRVQHDIRGHFMFLPGSGPAGADADWLLIRGSVVSGQGTALNVLQWWRSDDFGITWQFVRNASGTGLNNLPIAITRGQTGRLICDDAGTIRYSDDFGANWTGAGGVLFNQKTHFFEQAGNTWVTLMPGTLTGAGSVGISCDNGANWIGGPAGLGVTSANWAAVRLSPCEWLGTISGGVGVGQIIYYSTNGGETVTDQGHESRMTVLAAGNIFMCLFKDGAPFVVGVDSKTFLCGDRATGVPSTRTVCPLANAGLRKAGIPLNCGHPILTRCD